MVESFPTTSLPLIGYFPKKIALRPDWLKTPRVTAIRSASGCCSKGPDNWIEHWRHNELWLYSTQAAAIAVVPAADRSQFELHAYRMLPAVFNKGERQPVELPKMEVESPQQDFESVGFDAVACSCGSGFECSPLSCNSMADEIETNEHCLLRTLAFAEEIALRFSLEEPEPGPYYVVEILRRLTSIVDHISDLVAAELALIEDHLRVESLKTFLVIPRQEERDWDYGVPDTRYAYWVVAEVRDRGILLVYCEHGFGPEMPWGFLFANKPQAKTLGMDSQWCWYLEEAFIRSGLWDGPVKEDEEWNLSPEERFQRG